MKYLTLAVLIFCFGTFGMSQIPSGENETATQDEQRTKKQDDVNGDAEKTAGTDKDKDKAGSSTKPGVMNKPQSSLFWIFLKTGKSTEGVATEDVDAMQAEHIANFKRLATENKLLTAGPMQDPEKMLRGMVILRAKNYAEIEEMFSPDPYIQSGYLKIESQRMDISHGKINTKITPQGMSEFLMVLFQQAKGKQPLDAKEGELTESSLKSLTENEELRLAIKFLNRDKPRRGVLVFRKPKDDESRKGILKKISELPAVKNGKWSTRALPLLMGKGSLSGNSG